MDAFQASKKAAKLAYRLLRAAAPRFADRAKGIAQGVWHLHEIRQRSEHLEKRANEHGWRLDALEPKVENLNVVVQEDIGLRHLDLFKKQDLAATEPT
jgi:hypothetical protein